MNKTAALTLRESKMKFVGEFKADKNVEDMEVDKWHCVVACLLNILIPLTEFVVNSLF